ncbi:MAG: transglutaminaseTgpA domain-containing protein [Bdellovibrionales bacterium]
MKFFFRRDSFTLSVLTAILIVSIEVELWALVLSWTLIFYRFGIERLWWRLPGKIWINSLAVVALGLVLFQFRTFTGQEPSSTFLVMLSAIRILDFRLERDEKLVIFLGFVLISLKFLYSLDLYWFPVGAAVYLGLWRSLLPPNMKSAWRQTFISLGKSIPAVALLFFAFPRVQVPWARSWQPPVALSGFSESISPGEVANLSMSKETVMRVEFVDFVPNLNSLYWRGAALEVTDGFGWRKGSDQKNIAPTSQVIMTHDYIVTIEPTFQKVLPTLELTKSISTPTFRAVKNDRSLYYSENIIGSRLRYYGLSSENWSGPTSVNPTELPPLPPLTTKWIKENSKNKLSFQEKTKLLKNFFSNNNFVYTRQPGIHKNLDEFLFERREGFCEHFAGAYAVLARGLGIPTRVITGYQGGEKNTTGNFVRVSQSDAHAWVEIKDPNGRWRRVDPTYWIAPLRIELGADNYFQLSPDELRLNTYEALSKLKGRKNVSQFFDVLQNQFETLNYLWVRTLMEFDLSEQQKIIQFFAPQIGWWLSVLILTILGMRLIRKWLEKRSHRPPKAARDYLWIENLIGQRLNMTRSPSQPPIQFLESVSMAHPELTHLSDKTIQMYRSERYKNRSQAAEDWSRLRRGWKENASKPPT